MNSEILIYFSKLIEKELGIVYAEHNYFQLENRLENIVNNLKLESVQVLYEKAKNDFSGQFKQQILDAATNNETSFFRDQKVFEALEKILIDNVSKKNYRIWSAASSSGQEAYSIAMIFEKLNLTLNLNLNYQIIGTDISEFILNRAKKGQYSSLEVARGLSEEHLQRFFKKDEDSKWIVLNKLSKNIEFKKQNLKDDFSSLGTFDLIFCRNVLIYQSIESKINIITRMTNLLENEGIFILGSGESLYGLSSQYEQETVKEAIFYRKKITLKNSA